MTRDEHIAWCKNRALEYLTLSDPASAFASMVNDLNNHPETKNHPGIKMGTMLLINGHLSTLHEMRRFIEGFH
jgi:hypothetical protein